MRRQHEMPFGPRRLPDGSAVFRLWAPQAQAVAWVAAGHDDHAMQADGEGWFSVVVPRADTIDRYAFRIDGQLTVPDPASRSNPDGVHAASRLIDPLAFDWPDEAWRGRPWHEAVIYELHVGCFTLAGTFLAAIERLDALVALGVTAIELMPVAAFEGQRGWGYDGVLHFAPHAAYGTPDDFKQLVAAAHARGLMVLLDVVYNHFGPDGNYLHVYAQTFFNADVPTPWGAAINFGGPGCDTVRDFFIHNALYWIEEFHLDGLRIDAVHAMHDPSPTPAIDALVQAVRTGPGRQRPVHIVLENEHNDAHRLARPPATQPALADAQWNDDVHHAVHVMATGETDGYYIDFAAAPRALLGRALAEGFAFQGEPSPYRGGAARGTASGHLPPLAFVNSIQTHDQIGNRAFGERIADLATAAGREPALRALVACVLLAPSPPMLFMGEEWAAAEPFLFFCDYTGALAEAVRLGRQAEFGRFARFADPAVRERIPDPNSPGAFLASRLDWSARERPRHADWLAYYTALLRFRHTHLVPWLADAAAGTWAEPAPGTLVLAWPLAGGRRWHITAQLADHAGPATGDRAVPCPPSSSLVTIFETHPASAGALAPWSVRVALESP